MKFTFFLVPLMLGATAIAAPPAVSANATCLQDQDCLDTRTRAEREADAAEIRRLNREQARYVQERDARNAPRARAYDEQFERQDQYARDMDRYERERAQYEAQMAEWRRAVELCRQGYYEYCQ